MNPITIGLIVFAFAFGGALLGIYCRGLMPDTHLGSESKDIVKLAIGLIATMTALVLGLVVASAKSSFDAMNDGVRTAAVTVLSLDRVLARYGPETREIRDLIRRAVAYRVDSIWPEDSVQPPKLDDPEMARAMEGLEDRIHRLAPRDDHQRLMQSRALTLSNNMMQVRWLLVAAGGAAVPMPFLVVLVFWLTFIFAAFGLMAPNNATVIGILLVSALSVAVSIFLVLEMEGPFDGLVKVSSAPLRFVLSHIGQ